LTTDCNPKNLAQFMPLSAPLSNLNPTYTGRNLRDADTIRKQFTNHFINEGKLEWQDKMI